MPVPTLNRVTSLSLTRRIAESATFTTAVPPQLCCRPAPAVTATSPVPLTLSTLFWPAFAARLMVSQPLTVNVPPLTSRMPVPLPPPAPPRPTSLAVSEPPDMP